MSRGKDVNEPGDEKTERNGYSDAQVREFEDQIGKLRNEAARLKFDLGHLGEQLTVPRAKTFANQGLGRRLQTIERCVLNIFAAALQSLQWYRTLIPKVLCHDKLCCASMDTPGSRRGRCACGVAVAARVRG